VMGMLQVLERSELSSRQQETVDVLRDSAQLLTTVIDDILDFSKIEAGQMAFESVPFSPMMVLEGTVGLMSSRAHEKSLDLKLEIASPLPEMLKGDPVRLRQVLLNLVSNGIKFTQSGTVCIRAQLQDVRSGKASLLIEVCDSGCGLTEKQQAKLFLPFVQADASTTRQFGGTGLGLSICQRLVGLQGGSIGVESQLGKGSRFWFLLTFEVVEEPVTVLVSAPCSKPPKLDILLVEDNYINRRVAFTLLESEEHNVICAASGQEALDILAVKAVDIILMDMHMPNMDGATTARKIRALGNGVARIPIIMLTADVLAKTKAASLNAGIDAFLCKPFELDEINQTLVRLIGDREGCRHDPQQLPPIGREQNKSALIDLVALSAMRASLGDGLLNELISDLCQQGRDSIQRLQAILNSNGQEGLADIAHSLKGAARELQAVEVARLAAEIEGAKEIAQIGSLLPGLSLCMEETLAAYRQLGLSTTHKNH